MGCHDRRMSILTLCFLAYSGLWVSYLYFNAEITDSTGETVKFRDAVRNFLTSPLWRDLKQNLKNIFQSIWTVGLGETWKQVLISLDPQGEQQALQVLGLPSNAAQEEITVQWRKLSKEWHPDRYMNPEKKLEAQEKFMEFNAAYETLSKLKSRRSKKNKESQVD